MDSSVLLKLTIFSLLIAVVPIGSYFASLKYVWEGMSSPFRIPNTRVSMAIFMTAWTSNMSAQMSDGQAPPPGQPSQRCCPPTSSLSPMSLWPSGKTKQSSERHR